MKIINLEGQTTSTVSYSSNSWASC